MRTLVAILCVLVAGCCGYSAPPVMSKTDIEAVFMHEPHIYSVLVRNGQVLTSVRFSYDEAKLVADLKDDQEMWMEGIPCANRYFWENVTIHVHSARDINGAGWDRGKHIDGMTTPVERQ